MRTKKNDASTAIEFKFDPGGFMLCHSKKFMFVVIAKNASTTLKRVVYSFDFPERSASIDSEGIHELLGFELDNKRRVSISEGQALRAAGYLSFAVYRDPIARFLSLYRDKVSKQPQVDGVVRKYFAAQRIIGATLDEFLNFSASELEKNDPVAQDEHLRCQSAFYQPRDVDYIVPIEILGDFMQRYVQIDIGLRLNRSAKPANAMPLSHMQIQKLHALYQADYQLLGAENICSLGNN